MDREENSTNPGNNAGDGSGADGSSSRHRSVRVKRGRTDLASFHTSDSVFDEFEEPEEKRSKRGGYRRGRSAMKGEDNNGTSAKPVSPTIDADQQSSPTVQPTLTTASTTQDLAAAATPANSAVESIPVVVVTGEPAAATDPAPISAEPNTSAKATEEVSAVAPPTSTNASSAPSSASSATAPAASASLVAPAAPAAPKLSRGALAAATRARRKAEREAASLSPSRDPQALPPAPLAPPSSTSTSLASLPASVPPSSSAVSSSSHPQQPQASSSSSSTTPTPTNTTSTNGGIASSSNSNVIVGPVLYRPGKSLGLLSGHMGQLLKVHIHAQYLTAKNEQLVTRQIWGNKIYTDDSDVVAMICHAGFFTAKNSVPEFEGVSVLLRILPGQTSYPAVTQNDVQSRKWPQHEVSLSVESVSALPFGELGKNLITLPRKTELSRKEQQRGSNYVAIQNAAEADEAQQLLFFEQQRQRHVFPDSVIMYNLSNEICKKYTLGTVIDRGLEKSHWTSYRLKKEVLYFEHFQNRYELSRVGTAKELNAETNSHDLVDRYRWSLVLNPLATDMTRRSFSIHSASNNNNVSSASVASPSPPAPVTTTPTVTTRKGKKEKAEKESITPAVKEEKAVDFSLAAVPLPPNAVKVLADQLDWSELEWSTGGVSVRGKDTPLAKVFWRPIQEVPSSSSSSLPSSTLAAPNTQQRSKR